ncbi:MAG TPA: hypothetical protein VJM31_00945 [Vicinamibacterales bacterium]|nr:hypothetical protein [Vicinamibacterales bacterium]
MIRTRGRRCADSASPARLRVLLVLTLVTASVGPAFAQAVRVPGTKVSLTPPAGFSPTQQYPGFELEAERATIMVTELPGPAADMLRGMTKATLAARGMILVAGHDATIGGRPARLLNVRQKSPAGDVLKWMLIAGNDVMTIMIVGTFPAGISPSISDGIRDSLLTASWNSAAAPSAFEGLPFRVTPTSRLKLARRVSNMLMFTESGTTGSPGSTEALYLIGHSIGKGQLGDLRTFSEARAAKTTLTKSVTNFAGRTLQVDGLEGYELEADAIDVRSGAPMRLYQVIVPDDTGYFIMQGLSRLKGSDEMFQEFRAITGSFRREAVR